MTRVQILDKGDCVSLCSNALGKDMKSSILLHPFYGQIVGQTRFFSYGKVTSLGEWKLWIETKVFNLKIDLVSHSACDKRG